MPVKKEDLNVLGGLSSNMVETKTKDNTINSSVIKID
jgi:hypothetical protein